MFHFTQTMEKPNYESVIFYVWHKYILPSNLWNNYCRIVVLYRKWWEQVYEIIWKYVILFNSKTLTYFYCRQFDPQSVIPRQCILVSVLRQTIHYPSCVESLTRHNDERNYVYTIIVHGYIIMSVWCFDVAKSNVPTLIPTLLFCLRYFALP